MCLLLIWCVCFGSQAEPIIGRRLVFAFGLVGFGLGFVCVCVRFGFQTEPIMGLGCVYVCVCVFALGLVGFGLGLVCVCVCLLWVPS